MEEDEEMKEEDTSSVSSEDNIYNLEFEREIQILFRYSVTRFTDRNGLDNLIPHGLLFHRIKRFRKLL